jgi:phosphoglycolate phosphatase-like HAD superfamily hydrolase
MQDVPELKVAVTIERRRQPNRWEAWGFRVADVSLDSGSFGDRMRELRDDGESSCRLFPGLPVALHADEAEGYHLNLASGQPVWFVMWRIDDEDPSRAWPERVTLSYNEAARLLDAQERVDNLPLPTPVREWLQAYAAEHYRPEPKRRRKPASFLAPGQRG